MTTRPAFKTISHCVDVCVVGGGLAGIAAAISAARQGASVVLMQDRPMFGGNASSEIRMHVCGAERHSQIPNMRETGLLEEWRMENLYRNPTRSYAVWDTIFYESVMAEANITALMNCSCLDAELDGNKIASITGWQTTTQTYHQVKAKLFADCSGDGVLAPLSGADFRFGREARAEYNESIAPLVADDKTMGMTILFQARQFDTPQPFEALPWANSYPACDDLPYGVNGHRWLEFGYWWIELGGEADSIADTELLRHELLKIVYGVWDHLKNHCDHKDAAANWALDWVGFLPGKRESRRYVGKHVLTQNEVSAGGQFSDVVAYGGWTMDDHHPAGFRAVKVESPATIFHPAPSPYGIPYGVLVSENIENLMFAGRDASCTHAAMSSTRVMGTCFSMGQAVGTAAAIAVRESINPWDVRMWMAELQQTLIRQDCYLPGVRQTLPELTLNAQLKASQGNPEPVRDGWNRTIGNDDHAWLANPGDWIAYQFSTSAWVNEVCLVLDSALQRTVQMSYHLKDDQLTVQPPELPKKIEIQVQRNGKWETVFETDRLHQRQLLVAIGQKVEGVRFYLHETWGNLPSRVFLFLVQ